LRDCFAAGLESATQRLSETPASGTGIALASVSSGTIADLDPDEACRGISPELIAGVSQRLLGRLSGTALFAVDPGDALLWLQREGAAVEPLAHFVEWGSHVLSAVAEKLGDAWQADVSLADAVLEERPFMAALLGTHAPSDTVVLSSVGELSFDVPGVGAMRAPFTIQVLLQPKMLDGILTGLASGVVPE
jgi:hypothetical protein